MKYYLRQDRPNLTDDDINALLVAADEFVARVGVLDRQAKEIKDRHWPNPSAQVMETLRQMQSQKESIADLQPERTHRVWLRQQRRVHLLGEL